MSALYKKVLETGHVCQFQLIVYSFFLSNSIYKFSVLHLDNHSASDGTMQPWHEMRRESECTFLSTVNHSYDPSVLQTLKCVIVQNLWLLTRLPTNIICDSTCITLLYSPEAKENKIPKLMFIMYRSLIFI